MSRNSPTLPFPGAKLEGRDYESPGTDPVDRGISRGGLGASGARGPFLSPNTQSGMAFSLSGTALVSSLCVAGAGCALLQMNGALTSSQGMGGVSHANEFR